MRKAAPVVTPPARLLSHKLLGLIGYDVRSVHVTCMYPSISDRPLFILENLLSLCPFLGSFGDTSDAGDDPWGWLRSHDAVGAAA